MRSNIVHTSSAGRERPSQLNPKAARVGSLASVLPWTDWLQVLGLAAFVIALLLMRIEPGLAPIDESQNNLTAAPAAPVKQSATANSVR
jgi:hypothetical protein